MRSYLADASPRSGMSSSRTGQTSALLDRISRLQSRLNERVSLAGLANSIQLDKRKSESMQYYTTEASRFNEPPAVDRKLGLNADGADQNSARTAEVATRMSDSPPAASQADPADQRAPVAAYHETKGCAQDAASLTSKINELEDTLRASEAQSRNLRHQLTQTQEEFAKQSKELTAVSMSLDASKKSQDAIKSQLRMLEAEKEALEHVNHGLRFVADDSLSVQIDKMKLEIEGKDRKIKRLESMLREDATTTSTRDKGLNDSENEAQAISAAVVDPDPELQQYAEVTHVAGTSTSKDTDMAVQSALASPSQNADNDSLRSKKDKKISTLEVCFLMQIFEKYTRTVARTSILLTSSPRPSHSCCATRQVLHSMPRAELSVSFSKV